MTVCRQFGEVYLFGIKGACQLPRSTVPFLLKWILCSTGKLMEIDFHLKIAIDLRKIRCAHGLVSLKVYVTTGEDGENKMEANPLCSPAMLLEVTVRFL